MRLAVLAFALAAAVACSPPRTYPAAIQHSFMQACEARSAVPGLCACTWEQIEANVAPSDFIALENMPEAERLASPVSRQIEGYAMACASRLPPPPIAEPTPTP